jgi:citrate lyase subunit beta / citryl-CoA lyase
MFPVARTATQLYTSTERREYKEMRQQFRSANWYRSMLFVPGNKLDWMLKAPVYGADALIFDLEDSVPIEDKPEARALVAQALSEVAKRRFGRFVRLNGWHTGNTLQDLLTTVSADLDGVLLSKAEDVEDITALDLVLTDLELERGLPLGRIEIVPLCETALGMYKHYDICRCSERVRRSNGPGNVVIGGDATRAVGLKLTTDEGLEGLFVSGRSGLEARAAGVTQILGGITSSIPDLDLVRRLAMRAKALGANGSMAIHPTHVPILNEVFTPALSEIEEARETIIAMKNAIARGSAAVTYNGAMVDYAHVRTSLELLNQATSLGIDVGDVPDLPVLSFEG